MSFFRRVIVKRLSTNFREATEIDEIPLTALEDKEVRVRVRHLGINASDINFTAGKYTPGVAPPFPAGFEAVGTVEAVGSSVQKFKVGDAAAFSGYGAFSELLQVPEKRLLPVPFCTREVLPLMVSGLTASIALHRIGEIDRPHKKEHPVALVTAAAGGTGVWACQLLAHAGYTVIGTCSSERKAESLRQLGCSRVINYRKEDMHRVLRAEFPEGLDVVYESVGGTMFDQAVSNLADHGKLIVIGMISGYESGTAWKTDKQGGAGSSTPLTARLLAKSASVRGFFLNHFPEEIPAHTKLLLEMVRQGKIKSAVDSARFSGLEEIPRAIDHMYAGGNIGKVVVDLPQPSKL